MTSRLLSTIGLALSLVLCLPLAFLASVFDGPRVVVIVPKASGNTGAEVRIPITIAEAQDLGCLQMALLYDEKLIEVTGVEKGTLLGEHAIFDHDKTIPGRLGLGFLSGPTSDRKQLARINGGGTFCVVRFKVLGKAGQRSPLTPHKAQAWQVSDEKLTVKANAGEVLITGYQFPWLYVVLGVITLLVIGILLRRRRPGEPGV